MKKEELQSKAAELSAKYNREIQAVSLEGGEYAFMFSPDFRTQLKIIDSLRNGNSATVCDSALDNLVLPADSSPLVLGENKYRRALGLVVLSLVESCDAELIKKN